MSRSAKDSDEEIDVKDGRKTRVLTGLGSVSSPLRRSSRVRTAAKQFESSPESSASEASSVSKEQLTRTTRRRTSNMFPTVTENTRSLRPRKNSPSSDISETMEIDATLTPTKKTKNIAGSDILSKSNSRSSKRSTRAGSEAKSTPPITRVTRRTRASSVGSEVEVNQTKLSTPVEIRRRASILPSEATVVEEKEDSIKLDHTINEVKELNEMDVEGPSPKGTKKLSISIEKLDPNHRNTSQKIQDAIHGKPNDENILEQEESISTDNVAQSRSVSLEHNTSEVLSQNTSTDTLKDENVLSSTVVEQDEDLSNKENQAANINNDSQSRDDLIFSNVLLQSPKPLSESNVNVSKLSKEKCTSPSIETAMYSHSKDSSEITTDAIVSIKETITNTNTINNPTNTSEINALILDEDSDNMQKLVLSTDTESLNGDTPLNESINQDIVHVETCEDSSINGSIQIVECTDDVRKSNDDKFTAISNQSIEPANKSFSKIKECDEDADIKMDISSEHIEKITNTNEESEKDTINEIMVKDDKHETTKKLDKSNISENVMETDTLDFKETHLPPNLNNVTQSNSCIISKDDDATNNSQNIEETNNLLNEKTQKSSDAHISPRNSTSTNKNEDNITDVVKSSQSSTVAETPAESEEELPEKEKQQEKDSTLDDSLSSKKQSIDKSEPNEQKMTEADLETCKKNLESMDVDDNDSDTNTANLFQDIPVGEWKEKNDDDDKSSIHSLSTERLDNESEAECDLILVDREAWLAAENIRLEKEKELSDYDSDDTVLLKIQNDSAKAQNDRTVDESKDRSKLNVSKGKNLNTSKMNQSRQQEEIKDTKETKEQCTLKNNTSIRKSAGKKNISESHEETEKEDLNKSLTNTPLDESKSKDVLKKQKSPSKTIQEMDNELEQSSKIETAKRKSLSRCIESDSDSEDVFTTSKRNEKRQSLHDSSLKKIKSKQIGILGESDNESKESEFTKKKRSVIKKKLNKNASIIVDTDSDSDSSKNNIESEDSESESVELPKFLFGQGSDSDDGDDDKSNKSIDSDIQREYNLHGDDDAKFSDDDVPGDECRASETESSDPDDNGSDLTDFVVDDDEVEEEEYDEEEEGGESELEIDIEDDEENEKEDEEVVEEQDENIQSEEEMDGIEDEAQQEVTDEDEQEVIDKTATNKSLDTSNKRKSKLRKSVDTNLSETIKSSKKEKKAIADISSTETNEDEHLSYSPLLNSFTMKKSNKKRVSIDNEQLLNNSTLLFNKNVLKLNKSMECSTPTNSSCKRTKFNVSSEATSVKLTNETKEIEEDDDTNLNTEEIENRTLGIGNSSKKLSKENVMNRSVPLKLSESVKLIEKINLSRSRPSKFTELHKTVLAPSTVSPTTIYLEKEKLSRSAPELELDIKSMKTITDNINNEQSRSLISLENANVNIDKSDGEPTQEVNVSLRKKLFQVAENILEKDGQKKRKKRKKPTVTDTNSILFDQDNCKEDSPVVDNNNDAEILSNEKTKKRKKKKTVRAVVEEPLIEVETKPESKDELIHNEGKKKKKRQNIIENATESTSTNVKNKISTNKKDKNEKMIVFSSEETVERLSNKKRKLLKDVASESEQAIVQKVSKKKQKTLKDVAPKSEEVLVEKVPKKKQKLLKNIGSEREEVLVEKLSKKKKKLSNDVTSQNAEVSTEKLSKKKQKALLKDAQYEETLVESLPKKKQKNKGKSSKSHQSRAAELDLDEGSEVVAFSKARDKALEVIKRTTSAVKANKELKKKSHREHTQKMQNEEEMISKRSVKRLPDEVLENLSDVPLKSLKRRKLSKVQEQVLPSRSMFDSKAKKEITGVDEDDFIPLSSYGGTTQFKVVNLQKLKKKKKDSEVVAFREKMLTRNSRQPISAYLMYVEKQKASGKSKFCNKPY
ncbi:dentin sialophosphoprotein-like [Hylaeus volcanicus]|uniref:dentin sialophosphoprotein-like n=1 Tax=Hylaeus volcanicus TaxID=313075 RepID=UPI0023B7A92E|nr:dentin sialophosphoprotein-like [Hylaeus volcanicus]